MHSKKIKYFPYILLIAVFFFGMFVLIIAQGSQDSFNSNTKKESIISGKFDESKFKTEDEWRKILTPEQYYILRQKGTEAPFTGELNDEKRKGTYYSAGCDLPLFSSEHKFDSGTGRPSFWAPIDDKALVLRRETGGDSRIEVLDTCGNHLGHVFDDGPKPTGKRYCINSDALVFMPNN